MAITFQCKCGKALKTKDESAGKLLKCPGCGKAVRAPAPDEEEVAIKVKSSADIKSASVRSKQAASESDDEDEPRKPARKPAAMDEDEGKASRKRVPDDEEETQNSDDEDQENDDDEPRKPAKKGKKKSSELTELEESWKNSKLLSANEYQVIWDTWVAAKGRGATICRPGTKEELGKTEYRDSMMKFILRLFKMSFLPPWIEFRDEEEGTLFYLKVVSLVHNRYDVYAPDRKELLGSLKTIFSLKLWLRLLDADGNDVGEMVSADLRAAKGKNTYFGFHVKSSDGRILGKITSTGFHLSRFNQPNKGYKVNVGYVGRVMDEFADDPRTKAMVLAATWVANVENMGVKHLDPMKA